MAGFEIVDTFAEFLGFWDEARKKPMAEQIEGWASEYMLQWPELLERQIEAYCSHGVDWRRIAAEKVFPFLGERLDVMRKAHDNLLQACGTVRPFFGHWYDLMGKKQCGCFLGHELIKKLERNMTLKEVALLDSTEETFRGILEEVAGNEETLRGT